MEEQTQFINVIFDPNFSNFDQDLANMSLEKMMSIQFSEEILQKNFAVVINVLKQLHKGLVVVNGRVEENSNWVTELKKINEVTDTQDKVKELEQKYTNFQADYATKDDLKALKSKYDNILKDQDDQIQQLTQQLDKQKEVVEQHNNQISQNQQEIVELSRNLENLMNLIKDLDNKVQILQEVKHDNEDEQQTQQQQTESQPLPLLLQQQQIQIDPKRIQNLEDRLNQLDQLLQDTQNQIRNQPIVEKSPLNEQQQQQVDLTDINRQLSLHEEDIQKLFDLLDEQKKKMREQNNVGNSSVDSEEILQIKNEIKKLQNLIDQLQTQLNLASVGAGGQDNMSENQMTLILAEINKVRQQFQECATQADLANESQKITLKFKQCYDHIDDEIDKVRRELKNKIEKKADQIDLQKLMSDVAFLRDQFGKQRTQSQIVHVESQYKGPQLDPDFLQQFKDLQTQVMQIDSELINHKSQFSQYQQLIGAKLQDIEKKLQGLQTEKIFSELMNLRELSDRLHSESEQNKQKIKDFKNRIDQFMTKEEMYGIVDPKIRQLKEELTRQIEETKNKLDNKVETEDLINVEQKFVNKLEEVISALVKQMANKSETKKALIYLEQKINQIFMILEGEGNSDVDALSAKKPMWSCLSCDKDLDKYSGNLGDYKKWAQFPPKQTSPERMGRFGVGYKNMVDKQKSHRDKLDKERQQVQSMMDNNSSLQQSQSGNNLLSNSLTQLPKIKQ